MVRLNTRQNALIFNHILIATLHSANVSFVFVEIYPVSGLNKSLKLLQVAVIKSRLVCRLWLQTSIKAWDSGRRLALQEPMGKSPADTGVDGSSFVKR